MMLTEDVTGSVRYPLGEDIALFFFISGRRGEHVHCSLGLIVPESSKAWVLYDFVYLESWNVRMFRRDLEAKALEAEDERVMAAIDRLRRVEAWRKAALER
jgi:hypothetical protein